MLCKTLRTREILYAGEKAYRANPAVSGAVLLKITLEDEYVVGLPVS